MTVPKKPNAEIRNVLLVLADQFADGANLLREMAEDTDELVAQMRREIDELHNAKPLKPRAKNKSPKVTKAMARSIRAMANMGIANDQIAASFNINQGRVTDVLNGKYD